MTTHANQFRDTLPPDEVMLEPAGQFGTDLGNLRSAVHRAADRQTTEPVPFGWLNAAKRRRHAAQRLMVLAWTCAALLCIGALPFLHHAKPAVPRLSDTVARQVVTETDDTALLEQVDTAVSESVPSSLAPLDALDNLNSPSPTSTEPTLHTPEKKNVAQ